MALTPVNYVDGETIITAQNLNDIQSEIIAHGNTFVPKTRKVNNKSLTSDITLSASDVSAAPTSHASSDTTYGKGTNSNYGHVKLTDALDSTSNAASGGTALSAKAGKLLNDTFADYLSTKYTGVTTEIANNTDYNNLTTPGRYFAGSSGAETMTNAPSTSTGHLIIVMKTVADDRLLQVAILNSGSAQQLLWRYYSSSGWGSWYNPRIYSRTVTVSASTTAQTFSASVTLDNTYYPINIIFSDPLNVGSDVTVDTSSASMTITGTFYASMSVTVIFSQTGT